MLLSAVAAITLFICSSASASEHLLPGAYVHFNDPSPVSETARMTPADFEAREAELTAECEAAFGALRESLGEEAAALLDEERARHAEFLASYKRALAGERLDEAVKVFYGTDDERVTNVLRDISLEILRQRAEDLRRWSKGDFAAEIPQDDAAYDEAKRSMDNGMMKATYTMEEKQRGAEFEAMDAWRALAAARQLVVSAISGGPEAARREEILMMRRMSDARALQTQGLIFFRHEREE